MARMVPFPMLPTESAAERRLYEGFLEQLDESYVVYHSVDWVLAGRDRPAQGEADFVVAHRGWRVEIGDKRDEEVATYLRAGDSRPQPPDRDRCERRCS